MATFRKEEQSFRFVIKPNSFSDKSLACMRALGSKMTAVGFEPTQLSLVELESTPLDHSGKLSYISRVAFIVSEYVLLRRAESDMTLPRPDLSCFRRIIWQNCSRQAELACLSMFHCGKPPRWLLRGSLFVQMLPDPPSLGDFEQAQIG